MTFSFYKQALSLLSLVLCLLTTGCSSKSSEFFILNPTKFPNIQPRHACRQTIMVERVKIPGYIDKPGIVTRLNKNQLIQAEFHRWGEPLSGNITDVLAQNLSSQLAQDRILTDPRLLSSPVNYSLAVKVNQFDVDSAGLSILKVTWSLYNQNRKLKTTRNASYCSYAHNPSNYADITLAMNDNLTALSSDLAYYLRKLGCSGSCLK